MAQVTVAELLDQIAANLRAREPEINRRRAAVGLPPISLDPDQVEFRSSQSTSPRAEALTASGASQETERQSDAELEDFHFDEDDEAEVVVEGTSPVEPVRRRPVRQELAVLRPRLMRVIESLPEDELIRFQRWLNGSIRRRVRLMRADDEATIAQAGPAREAPAVTAYPAEEPARAELLAALARIDDKLETLVDITEHDREDDPARRSE